MFPEWKCEWKCECECGSEIPLSEPEMPACGAWCEVLILGTYLALRKGDRGNSSVCVWYVLTLGAVASGKSIKPILLTPRAANSGTQGQDP